MAVADTRNAPVAGTETTTEKGISFAKGPALVLGTILLAAGLYSLYKEHTFVPWSNFPNGTASVEGKVFGIFGANGWTGMLTAVAGGLLLFGAAQHLLAKTMSLIVGIGLGAAAVIALISGDVLGMAAANHLTELAWGIAAAILLVNTLAPRRRRRVTRVTDDAVLASATGAAASDRAPRRRVTRDAGATQVADERAETEVPSGREPATERVAPAEGETSVMRDEGETRVMRDEGETRVMHDRGEDASVASEGQATQVDQRP